jgi:hypothetical protein
LRFALEIRDELGHYGGEPAAVPAERIEAAVVNHIYGGVNVIGGTVKDFTQIGSVLVPKGDFNVPKGDFNALTGALKRLDIPDKEIGSLKEAIEADGKSKEGGLGKRASAWLKRVGTMVGREGFSIGTAATQELVKAWLLQYCGLKS